MISYLTLYFRYKYILITNWFYIMYIIHSYLLSHIYIWITFVKATFSKSIIFNVKSIFEPNVLKWVIKTNFISSSSFVLLTINVKILSNFQKEWCTFGRKKDIWIYFLKIVHFQGLSALNMQKHFWLCQALSM